MRRDASRPNGSGLSQRRSYTKGLAAQRVEDYRRLEARNPTGRRAMLADALATAAANDATTAGGSVAANDDGAANAGL